MSSQRSFGGNVGKPERDQAGLTAVEYALLAGVASVAIFAAVEEIGLALVRILLRLAQEPFW